MKDRIEKLIEDKEMEDNDSSQRDVAFLRSLRASYDKWGGLTEKQKSAFERMEFLSSPAGQEEVKKWTKEYKEKYAKTANIIALYYLRNSHFFRNLCIKIVSDQSYVPTKDQLRALCGNKYATKVIKELQRPPSFNRGDLVRVRESSNIPMLLYPYKGRICVVVENKLETINSHATGSKEYRLLPFGSTDTIVCQERHIKAMRKKAK